MRNEGKTEKRLDVLAMFSILAIISTILLFGYAFYNFWTTPYGSPMPFLSIPYFTLIGIIWFILIGLAMWFWVEILIKQAKMKRWVWFVFTLILTNLGIILALIFFYAVYKKNLVR